MPTVAQNGVRSTITGNLEEFLYSEVLTLPPWGRLSVLFRSICGDKTLTLLQSESQSPFINPFAFCSLLTEADAGHTEFMDEVFQNETRFPGGEWKPAAEPYTDVVNNPWQSWHHVKNVKDKR